MALPSNKPAEFFKANQNQATCLRQPLIREAWYNESFPSEWTDGIIIKIPKKGNLRECDNWRGNYVLPAVSKIIAKVILERKDPLISAIEAEQAGFKAGGKSNHRTVQRIAVRSAYGFHRF